MFWEWENKGSKGYISLFYHRPNGTDDSILEHYRCGEIRQHLDRLLLILYKKKKKPLAQIEALPQHQTLLTFLPDEL